MMLEEVKEELSFISFRRDLRLSQFVLSFLNLPHNTLLHRRLCSSLRYCVIVVAYREKDHEDNTSTEENSNRLKHEAEITSQARAVLRGLHAATCLQCNAEGQRIGKC